MKLKKLFVPSKIAYICCFSYRGNLDFPRKSFITFSVDLLKMSPACSRARQRLKHQDLIRHKWYLKNL